MATLLPMVDSGLPEVVKSSDFLKKARPHSKTKTTYGKMNEWMTMPGGRDMRSGVPLTMSDGNWQQMKQREGQPADQRGVEEDFNSKFQRSYSDLTSKIAYRYPNPGLPRLRQGRIGGSWRHIKEVLGHGGSRVCYVDGLVGVYDEENFNQTLSTQGPYRPHLKRVLYSPNRGFISPSQAKPNESLPAVEELPMMSANERARKMAIQSPNKHKGVYAYN